MNKAQYKTIDYAYPTSTLATKHGFGKVGCFTVQLATSGYLAGEKSVIVDCFQTKQEAIAYADSMPNDWHWVYDSLYDRANNHAHRSYEQRKQWLADNKARIEMTQAN